MMRSLATASALLVTGCAVTPYDPGRADLPIDVPADAFARIRDVVRLDFPVLLEADPERFLFRSDWCPRDEQGVASQCRLTMWREDDELLAVVEVRYLRRQVFGVPEWGSVRGHRFWERAMLDKAVAALRQ